MTAPSRTSVTGRDFHVRDQDVNGIVCVRVPTLEGLARWMQYLRIMDCLCPWEWVNGGVLHGVQVGKSWYRASTNPDCPQHGGDR